MVETRGKNKRKAVERERSPEARRSKKSKQQQSSKGAGKAPAPRQAEKTVTRTRSKAGSLLEAVADPEALLHHKRASPRGQQQQQQQEEGAAAALQPEQQQEQAPDMDRSRPGGAGPDRDLPDEDELGRNASAMEGLLRRLGLSGVFAGGASTRVRTIITQLKDDGDEMNQLTGLTDLCEYLSISTEESLMTFPVEQVVPLLVQLMGMEHNPDIMLLAARALTFLADYYPSACASIIRHGAVPVFCARLLTIEFIDLAEQSLQALEKLSHEHPASLLRHGGLVAVLSFLDFFPTGVQRTAVSTAANICRGLSAEHADAVATAAPILIGLLQNQDAKLVDTACLALTRIAEAFSKSPANLEMLCSFGLITSITQMVRVEESGSMTSQLSVPTFYGLIKLLATCAAGSHVVVESLLEAGISSTLHNLLSTSTLFNVSGASPGNVLRSTDQLGDLVSLTAQLLPPLPDAAAAMVQGVPPSPSFAADGGKKEEPAETCQRTKFLRDNPELLRALTADLLPPLLKVYSSSVTPTVKRQCLTSIAKMMFFNQPQTLQALLEELPVSSFIGALLRARDATVAAFGMQMAEILMEKLPDVFGQYFLKEGVVHAMEQLEAASPPPAAGAAAALPATAEQAGASGESSAVRTGAAAGTRSGGLRRAKSAGAGGAAGEPKPEAAELGGSGAAGTSTAVASAPGGSAVTPAGDSLRNALAGRARRFRARYFTDSEGNAVGCTTEGVKTLQGICERLPDPQAVAALLSALAGTGNAAVSTFELLSSGAVKALKGYLQGADLMPTAAGKDSKGKGLRGAAASAAAPPRPPPLPLLERMHVFSQVALPPGSGGTPPLGVLVSKMLGALATCETFAVQIQPVRAPPSVYDYYGRGGGGLARTTSGASGSLAAGLAALSSPLKVRLARASDDSTLREFNSVVAIDALASMAQLEEFLWPRVCPTTSAAAAAAANAARDDSRSRQAQGAAGAGATRGAAGAAGAGAASVNAPAAAAAAASKGRRGSSASVDAEAGGRPGSGGGRPASKNRPIPAPQGARRMTRAQARAAAEAEVAGNSYDEEQPQPPAAAAEPAKGSPGSEGDVLEGEAEDLVIGGDEEYDSEEEIQSDDDMEDAGGYVEGDGYDDGEEDDLGIGSMTVHDMHLEERAASPTQPPRSSSRQAQQHGAAGGAAAPGQARPPSSSTQQQQQSYAQAAGGSAGAGPSGAAQHGSGAQQAAGHGEHGGGAQQAQQAAPSLAFYLGGRLLAPGTTIFQAVHRHLESKGGGRGMDSIWAEVHTLTYRPYAAAIRLQESEAATSIIASPGGLPSRPPSSTDAESGRRSHDDIAASPLSELIPEGSWAPNQQPGGAGASAGGNTLDSEGVDVALAGQPQPQQAQQGEGGSMELVGASQEARDVLEVLRVLEALNRLAPHLESYLAGRAGSTARTAGGAGAGPPLGAVPRDDFVSSKLAPKLAQQLKDVLSICGGTLPSWCRPLVTTFKFLFPFETRRRFFYCTSFGLARALGYLQQVHAAEHGPGSAAERDARELRIGRLQRQKVRISRRHLLESALKVFEMYAQPKSLLEIEYFGEVGTGLGPTLEFYTLISHELQRKSLGLWRHCEALGGEGGDTAAGAAGDDGASQIEMKQARGAEGPGPLADELSSPDLNPNESVHSSDLVRAPQGLFPQPLPPGGRSPGAKGPRYFSLLGKVVAKALQDGRLLDLPLSPVFYRLALGGRVDLYDIRKFDAQLGASIEKLHAAFHAHSGGSEPLLVDGCPIDDLCLSFVLPGYPGFELAPGGAEVTVTADNLRAYIDAVVDATLGSGVSAQVEAFRQGFSAIFPLESLAYFYEDEIEAMLCGTGEAWSVEQLSASIKFDHGFTSQSTAVRFLLEVLSELDALDQRRFLRFVTGSPRLPPGGLAALQPRLTVVRKLSTAGAGDAAGTSAPGGGLSAPSLGTSAPGGGRSLADGDLPSVMTCVNYIKLPPYSSKEVLRDRLLFAIREGQGSFDLS